jgi:hypothetical protein
MNKEKKKVTFAYVPAYKDEDDDGYRRRRPSKRLAKDLPTIPSAAVDLDDKE